MDTLLHLLLMMSCLYISSNGHDTDLPAGIQKCSINDEQCLLNGMNYVIKNHAKTGIKELGLVPLDPLHIKRFSLGKKPNSPVSIDLSFTNADLIGLSEAQIKRITPFNFNLSRPIIFNMLAPRITLQGPYSIDGKVLILPIVGKGDAKIVLENCRVHAVVKLRAVSKSPGLTFADVFDVKMKLEPSLVSFKFDGLFGGEKELSKNLHMMINDNWRDIFQELKPEISGAMGLIFKGVLNKTMSKLPLEQLFLDVEVNSQ